MPNTFNTGDPIAYFLTWTSYGTWLPGDDRGWNRKGDEANLHPDPLGHDSAGSRLKEAPFILPAALLILQFRMQSLCDSGAYVESKRM